MKRNIDILKELQQEITAFKLTEEEILLIAELEDSEIEGLIESESTEVDAVVKTVNKIGELLDRLTEDLRDTLDYEDFDCGSYRWCVAKIRHNPYELVNYMESFSEAISSLDMITTEYLKEYKLLTQTAYDESYDLPEIQEKAGAL